jgi:UDP-3-O-[3-hydroxymyristoyl] glucosamine N-acyltransferase
MPKLTLREIAERLGGRLVGEDRTVSGVQSLEAAGPEDLSFAAHLRYQDLLETCRAGGVLVPPGVTAKRLSLIVVERPLAALARIMPELHPEVLPPPGTHPSATIPEDCRLGGEVRIGPHVSFGSGCRVGDRSVLGAGVVLGRDVEIGSDCRLHPGARILDGCRLGNRVILQAGAVVGSDGFGFAEEGGVHLKIPQIGNVVLEDDVELGANATVDRATFGSTRIRRGTKIDNLVQIGHNCDVGEDCILVAQVGLAGSVRVGRGTIFAGQSGSVGHVRIGENVRVGAKSAVTGDLPDGAFVTGHPARDHGAWRKSQAGLLRLPELRHRVAELERRLEGLGIRPTKEEG